MFWREEEEEEAVVQAGPSPPQEDPPGVVPPGLLLGLGWVCAALYCALFLVVYVQLWLLLRSGRRRLSLQSGSLFLSLLAAALRTTMFTLSSCDLLQDGRRRDGQQRDGQLTPRRLQPLTRWLLYCLPVCLQFCTLCMLNLYFAQVMFKAKAKYSPELSKYKVPLRLAFLCLSIFFLVVNLTCALLIQTTGPASAAGVRRPLLARVLVNDFLFTLCAVSLAVCIFRIAKMSSANVYLESKGTSLRQATAMGALLILLFTSRACYNLVVVALAPGGRATPFSYGWYSVSDQADVQEVSGETYVVFAVVLLVWELLPTGLLVGFFRVQQPNQNLAPGGMINSHSFSSRAYFFDNPRRYDSEDDLTRSINSRSDRASLLSTTPQTGPPAWYGSVPRAGSQPTLTHPAAAAAAAAASAPLLCAYPGVPGHGPPPHHHHNLYSTPQNNGGRHQQSQHCSTPQNRYCSSQNYYCTPTN